MSVVAIQEAVSNTESAVSRVAHLLAGIATIGEGREVVEKSGSLATIVANRINVDHEVVAQYVSCNGHSFWHIYAADGKPPTIVVGAKTEQGHWIGAVD